MANMDFQLVVDIDKVIVYTTKYVITLEFEISSGMHKIIEQIINKLHVNGLTTKAILKIFRLLGLCTISKQKSCH